MLVGYNTNGLVHHTLLQAIELLSSIGYQSIGITVDHHVLNPFDPQLDLQVEEVKAALAYFQLVPVIETGAGYLLDPRQKHEPTFVSPEPRDRHRRVDFVCRGIDIARQLGARCVSLWSGRLRDKADDEEAFARLIPALERVLVHAQQQEVVVAFEPEPGMFIDTMARFDELVDRFGTCGEAANSLALTLDIGHLHCVGDVPIDGFIRQHKHRVANVHIEDMRRGTHEHLMFGEGEIDFPPIIAALREIDYQGSLTVELSRHSHMGPEAAQTSFEFLQRMLAPQV